MSADISTKKRKTDATDVKDIAAKKRKLQIDNTNDNDTNNDDICIIDNNDVSYCNSSELTKTRNLESSEDDCLIVCD